MKNYRIIVLILAFLATFPAAYWLLDKYGLKSEKAAIEAYSSQFEDGARTSELSQAPSREIQQKPDASESGRAAGEYVDKVVREGESSAASELAAPPTAQQELSKGGYTTFFVIVFALLCLAFVFSRLNGNLAAGTLISATSKMLLGTLLLFGAGWLVIRLTVGVISALWFIIGPAIVVGVFLAFYNRGRNAMKRKASATSIRRSAADNAAARYDFMVLFAALIAMLIWAIVLWIIGEPSHYLVVPMASVCISILLLKFTKWRLWPLLSVVMVLLYALVYCVPACIGSAGGWFWQALVLTLLYLGLMVPMSNLYLRKG